jgi:hypothetical protein
MKIFHCDHCAQPIFFENVHCLSCHHPLAFLPDLKVIGSLEALDGSFWRSPIPAARGHSYRLCENYDGANVCNWAVPSDDANPLCRSCRLTRMIPDLDRPGNREAWYRLEVAKRRVVYSLLNLGLPARNKVEDPEHGLVFEFRADLVEPGAARVLTGHRDGLITIDVAEADDAQRESRRLQMHEPYRTLLGHFRHEIGHYYWDRLIQHAGRIDAFRQVFGDESESYQAALQRHYDAGVPPDWQQRFISPYASSHPWEDWAETWAHYLHMTDTLETAAACGLALRPLRADEPSLKPNPRGAVPASFQRMITNWFAVTYLLNNLNRGLGLPDGYPFVLSPTVIDKLRFIHDTVELASRGELSPPNYPDGRGVDAADGY